MWFVYFLFFISSIIANPSKNDCLEKIENIANQRSQFSPLEKISIEEAYVLIGKYAKNQDIMCFKFIDHPGEKRQLIQTFGKKREDDVQINTLENVKFWMESCQKQIKGVYFYSENEERKTSYVYDLGKDNNNYWHFCVLVMDQKKKKRAKEDCVLKKKPVKKEKK